MDFTWCKKKIMPATWACITRYMKGIILTSISGFKMDQIFYFHVFYTHIYINTNVHHYVKWQSFLFIEIIVFNILWIEILKMKEFGSDRTDNLIQGEHDLRTWQYLEQLPKWKTASTSPLIHDYLKGFEFPSWGRIPYLYPQHFTPFTCSPSTLSTRQSDYISRTFQRNRKNKRYIHKETYKELAHVIIQAKSPNLPSARWTLGKANGVIPTWSQQAWDPARAIPSVLD